MDEDELQVWLFDPSALDVPAIAIAASALLTAEESERATRYVFEPDRRAFVAARAITKTLLATYLRIPARAISFSYNAFGKPILLNAGPNRVAFNLSHTRGLVACAVAHHYEVGVDVEAVRSAPLDLIDMYLAAQEADFIRGCPLSIQNDAFFAIWTLKEAFVKARGLGLSIPLDSFACQVLPPSLLPYGDAVPADWQFAQWKPAIGFVVSACVSVSGVAPRRCSAFSFAPTALIEVCD